MLEFKCLSTGSTGNCYLLKGNDETLILDCGIPKREIVAGLDYNVSNVVGIIVSHCHRDHSLAIDDLFMFDVWQPYLNEKSMQKKTFGNFSVQSFELPHNGTENCGFLIKYDNEKLLYMTDFEYCEFDFSKLGITQLIIECNYDLKFIDKDIPNYQHKVLGHCEFEVCKDFIESVDSEKLQNVILIHMGHFEYTYAELVEKIQKHTNAKVFYAEKGLEVTLKE